MANLRVQKVGLVPALVAALNDTLSQPFLLPGAKNSPVLGIPHFKKVDITGYKIKNDGKLRVPYFLPYNAFMICIIGKLDMHNYL